MQFFKLFALFALIVIFIVLNLIRKFVLKRMEVYTRRSFKEEIVIQLNSI